MVNNFGFVREVGWVIKDYFGFGFEFYFFNIRYGGFDVDSFVVFFEDFVYVGVEYVGIVVDGREMGEFLR